MYVLLFENEMSAIYDGFHYLTIYLYMVVTTTSRYFSLLCPFIPSLPNPSVKIFLILLMLPFLVLCSSITKDFR